MTCVSILIVNYNGAAFIADCLDSLFNSQCQCEIDVVIVDNASTDNSLDVLSRYIDKVTLVKSAVNIGFGRGNNLAFDSAKGDIVFLLNNDTVLKSDTLQILVDFMHSHSNIGAIAPKLLNRDGSLQAPGSIFGRWRFLRKKPQKVPFIAGAAVMMWSSVYKEIGGFDKHMFFYNEDIDLCMMLKKKKTYLYYVPSAELLHYGGLSTKFRKLDSVVEGYRGGMYLAYKHYPRVVFYLYRVVLLLDLVPRLFIYGLLSVFLLQYRSYFKAYYNILLINKNNDIFLKEDV